MEVVWGMIAKETLVPKTPRDKYARTNRSSGCCQPCSSSQQYEGRVRDGNSRRKHTGRCIAAWRAVRKLEIGKGNKRELEVAHECSAAVSPPPQRRTVWGADPRIE